jgi:hypothetical protein
MAFLYFAVCGMACFPLLGRGSLFLLRQPSSELPLQICQLNGGRIKIEENTETNPATFFFYKFLLFFCICVSATVANLWYCETPVGHC